MKLILVIFLCVFISCYCQTLVVNTTAGFVQGTVVGGIRRWAGIPYAAPPIGTLRWMLPQPPANWSQVFDASDFGASCMQSPLSGAVPGKQDEDCLTLNVFAPLKSPHRPLPVMIWIYGGGFEFGSSLLYDFSKLTLERDVVIVSMNYRLGPLGFVMQRQLLVVDPHLGVLGLKDQQAAFTWVQQNIINFGGDPSQVTIFGESAGGFSVLTHLILKDSQGLFKYAISESGGPWKIQTAVECLDHGDQWSKALGCPLDTTLPDCMRAKDAKTIMSIIPPGKWGPCVDVVNLQDQVGNMIKGAQTLNAEAVILGSNRNEGTLFAYEFIFNSTMNVTYAQYKAALQQMFGPIADVVLNFYITLQPTDDYWHKFAWVFGDVVFTCPTRAIARAISAAQNTSYLYMYNHPYGKTSPMFGAYHSDEIPFVLDQAVDGDFTAQEQELASNIGQLWTSFAKYGIPEGWPSYQEQTDDAFLLDLTLGHVLNWRKGACDFWDSHT